MGLIEFRGQPVQLSKSSYGLDSGHGRPIEPISEQEFHSVRRHQSRIQSGFYIVFYLAAIGEFFAAARDQRGRKTPLSAMDRAENGGPMELQYTWRGAGRLIDPWPHSLIITLCTGLALICCGGVVGYLILRRQLPQIGLGKLALCIVVILSAGVVPSYLVNRLLCRHFPARCLYCRGRAYCISSRPVLYLCRDCLRVSEP